MYHTTFNPYWQIPVEEDQQRSTKGEGPGARALPLGPTQYYIFRVSSDKLRHLHLCSMCAKHFCYVEKDRASLQHGSELILG